MSTGHKDWSLNFISSVESKTEKHIPESEHYSISLSSILASVTTDNRNIYLRLFSKQKPPVCSSQGFELWSMFSVNTEDLKMKLRADPELNRSVGSVVSVSGFVSALLLGLCFYFHFFSTSQAFHLSTVKSIYSDQIFFSPGFETVTFWTTKPRGAVRGLKKFHFTEICMRENPHIFLRCERLNAESCSLIYLAVY